MKYVDAYYRLTGRKRRIPEKWLARNVFGDSWSLTPRSRGYTAPEPVEPTPEPSPSGDDSPTAPTAGDTKKGK